MSTRRRSGSRGRQLDFLSSPELNLRLNSVQAGHFIGIEIQAAAILAIVSPLRANLSWSSAGRFG